VATPNRKFTNGTRDTPSSRRMCAVTHDSDADRAAPSPRKPSPSAHRISGRLPADPEVNRGTAPIALCSRQALQPAPYAKDEQALQPPSLLPFASTLSLASNRIPCSRTATVTAHLTSQ
jgi:hypothetical protein